MLSGELEIKVGDRFYKQDMNTFVKGAIHYFGGLFGFELPPYPESLTYYGHGISYNSTFLSNKSVGIYCDNIDTPFDKTLEIRNEFLLSTSNSIDPLRSKLSASINSFIVLFLNNTLVISKTFKNISTETLTIRNVYLTAPVRYWSSQSGFSIEYFSSTTLSQSVKNYVLALEKTSFEVAPNEEFVISFRLEVEPDKINTNFILFMFMYFFKIFQARVTLSAESQNISGFKKTDGTLINYVLFPTALTNDTYLFDTPSMFNRKTALYDNIGIVAGTDDTANTADYFKLNSLIPQSKILRNIMQIDKIFTGENTYTVVLRRDIVNISSETLNIRELGLYYRDDAVSGSTATNPFCIYRTVLPETVTILPGEGYTFSINLNFDVNHLD